jgi:hypothetical protein
MAQSVALAVSVHAAIVNPTVVAAVVQLESNPVLTVDARSHHRLGSDMSKSVPTF